MDRVVPGENHRPQPVASKTTAVRLGDYAPSPPGSERGVSIEDADVPWIWLEGADILRRDLQSLTLMFGSPPQQPNYSV